MTRKGKQSGRRGRTQGVKDTNSLLKELVTLQRRQTIRDQPEVPDVIPMQLKRRKLYTFQRSQDFGLITSSNSTVVQGAYVFALSQLPDYTEFTALFDSYRILQVRFSFFPLFIDTTATTAYPAIKTVIDYEDNTVITLQQAEEYDSLLVSQTGTYFERVIVPRCSLSAYNVTPPGYSQAKALTWLDCASPDVTHYGLKIVMPVAGAVNAVWQPTVHYTLQFKNSR
jgi:hypothetical protein